MFYSYNFSFKFKCDINASLHCKCDFSICIFIRETSVWQMFDVWLPWKCIKLKYELTTDVTGVFVVLGMQFVPFNVVGNKTKSLEFCCFYHVT